MATSLPDPRPQRFVYYRRRHSSMPMSHFVQGVTMERPVLTQNLPEAFSHIQTLPADIQSQTQPIYPIPLQMPQFINPAHRGPSGGSGSMSPQQLLFNPVSPAISPTVPNPSPPAPTSPGGYAPTSPSNSISSGSSMCFGIPPPQYKPYDRSTDSPKSFISEPPFPTDRPSTAESLESFSSADERKNMPCQYFLAGHCNYGDNCWYYHPTQPSFAHYYDRDSRIPILPHQYSRGRVYLPAQNVANYPQLMPPISYIYPGQFPSQPMHHPMVSPYNRFHRHFKQRPVFPCLKIIHEEKLRHVPVTGFIGCLDQIFILNNKTVLMYEFCYLQSTNRITLSCQGEETFGSCNISCIQCSPKHVGIVILGCEDGRVIAWNWIVKQYLVGDHATVKM